MKSTFDSSGIYEEGTLILASPVAHCGYILGEKKETEIQTEKEREEERGRKKESVRVCV